MNGQEIASMLARVPNFLGVFAADTLNSARIPRNGELFALVVNTDRASEPGRHWLALLGTCGAEEDEEERTLYYFDSFGGRPRVRSISRFCRRHFSRVHYNRRRHQRLDEETCGAYCVYVINEMCARRRSFHSVLRSFERIKRDDEYVRRYLVRCFRFHF